MTISVSLEPENLPDITASKDDAGVYEVSITGLSGLVALTMADLAPAERVDFESSGIVEINPPTVRTSNKSRIELLMLQAVERVLPAGLLDNLEDIDDAQGAPLDKEMLLCGQLTRTVRLALLELEPPE